MEKSLMTIRGTVS